MISPFKLFKYQWVESAHPVSTKIKRLNSLEYFIPIPCCKPIPSSPPHPLKTFQLQVEFIWSRRFFSYCTVGWLQPRPGLSTFAEVLIMPVYRETKRNEWHELQRFHFFTFNYFWERSHCEIKRLLIIFSTVPKGLENDIAIREIYLKKWN